MQTIQSLELLAVQAAKKQDWKEAIAQNQLIIDQDPKNIPALIRGGVAHAQLDEKAEAKVKFLLVLDIDKSNALAKKHLDKLKHNHAITLSSFSKNEEFIEEPGKTKSVELHRLAGKEQLDSLAIGQSCTLKPKSRFISVEAGKTYIGSLPEDLSARLSKLMKSGNEYACLIQSLSNCNCTVFLKETTRSKHNEFINSFPVNKTQLATINDMLMSDDSLPLQLENVPMQIVDTDKEDDAPEKFEVSEPMDDVQEDSNQDQDRDRDRDRD